MSIHINKLIANSITITTGDPELKIPLYFEANEAGASVAMLCWDNSNDQQTSIKCHLQYSTNKMATWATYDGSIVYLDRCEDKRVYFRADPENPNTDGFYKGDYEHEECWTHYFKTVGSVKAGGNIQFLLESTGTRTDVPEYGFYQLFGYNSECSTLTTTPSLPATNLADYCYYRMFFGCSSLTTAPALPATTLASGCYQDMFNGCTSLTIAPSLPATTLADSCYSYMFNNCTSLMTAPALPARTLANRCYEKMFYGCTSLATAPALPAMTIAENCYDGMFSGCTSLATAPVLPATTLAKQCYYSMFSGCSKLASMDVSFSAWNPSNATKNWVNGAGSQATDTKTFTCPSALPKTTGNNNIPYGWTIIKK